MARPRRSKKKTNVTAARHLLAKFAMAECGAAVALAGVAAAAVYLSSKMSKDRQDERTQRQISEAAGVTEVTIRNRFKELCKIMDYKG